MSEMLRIGVAGLGTVGAGVLQIVARNGDLLARRCGKVIEVTAVSARNRGRDRGVSIDGMHWHDNPVDLAADPAVDVVVELIGGEDGPAKALAEAALEAGKPFVTANKALIAHHGNALAALAAASGTALRFEAAVAGGIPIIKALSEGLAANRHTCVYGILNGTCNYILTEMEQTGRAFGDVLAEAQQLGYAEADPTFDVDGIDAAHKLAILTGVAYGVPLDFSAVYVEGLRHITPLDIEFAAELGYRIKLMGITEMTDQGISQRVHPCLVGLEEPIAHVMGVDNAVVVQGDAVGRTVYEGPGAGAGPTASAVLADILDIARGAASCPLVAMSDQKTDFMPMDAHEGRYYLRFAVSDQPGVLATVTAALSDEGVSVEELLQRPRDGGQGDVVDVVMTTHETGEAKLMRAVEQIAKLPVAIETPEVIRIEEF